MRGKALASLAGARTAEAIVPAVESDDRYRGIARREATDVAPSRCRHCDRIGRVGPASESVARRHELVFAPERLLLRYGQARPAAPMDGEREPCRRPASVSSAWLGIDRGLLDQPLAALLNEVI
jgi:hypothetical protein